MSPATGTDVKQFFARFNQMTETEQDEAIKSGRLVLSPADLEGLPPKTVAFFRAVADKRSE